MLESEGEGKAQTAALQPLLNIAIIGRPNVGKSTLFNRLCGSKAAIVSEVPGTTRDRKMMKGFIAGMPLNVVDTGGFDDRGEVSEGIKKQVEAAISSADVVVFMLDARTGVTAVDEELGRWARKRIGQACAGREGRIIDIVVLANKTEGAALSDKIMSSVNDALRIGLGNPILISASHGDGMADLAAILLHIAQSRGFRTVEDPSKPRANASSDPNSHATTAIPPEERTIQLAIMGRPNVGKSTLLNALIGEERVLTGPLAGLTR
jgi:GTP-binding protein